VTPDTGIPRTAREIANDIRDRSAAVAVLVGLGDDAAVRIAEAVARDAAELVDRARTLTAPRVSS
jgi:hypothetical protein